MSEGVRVREAPEESPPADGAGPVAGATSPVPLLEDLTALLGLIPTISSPEPEGAPPVPAKTPRPKGRRPLAAELRTRPFSVRLTREERALLYRAALLQRPGEHVSCWAKSVLVAVARALVGEAD